VNRADKDALKGLVEFARCNPASLANWRSQWPDFFPETFWNRDIKQTPTRVVFGPMWRVYQDVLLNAWRHGFTPSDIVRLIVPPVSGEFDELSSVTEASPYQRAVLLVAMEPWRARFCSECGQPFAADKGASKFCSPGCYAESRRDTKRRWWAEQGSEQRRKARVKQSHSKGRKSG